MTCHQFAIWPGFLLAAATLTTAGQKPPSSGTDAESAERLERMKRQAAEYVVKLQTDPPTELKLIDQPLLRFDNPVGGVRDGIIAMWKDGNRPAVVAQVFQIRDGQWIHECQSLARSALSMERDGDTVWEPQQAAEAFRPLSDAPQPADTPVKRLVQMRSSRSSSRRRTISKFVRRTRKPRDTNCACSRHQPTGTRILRPA